MSQNDNTRERSDLTMPINHSRRGMSQGRHHTLLIGPPGLGKTMLAKRFMTILPDISLDESLETTKVHCISGRCSRGCVTSTTG